jgi:heme exporter protein CcmB
MMGAFSRVVWIVARKDLAIEARSRELLNTTVFFALSCVIVFSVSFVGEGGDGRAMGDAAAGILWIAIAFSGTLALGRTFERERYGDTLRALLLAPGTRSAVYVGKLVGIVALLLATEVVVVPLVALLFQAKLFEHFLITAALLVFGTVGFASVGTLFAAMLARARSRDVLLPILLYPVTIPVMIAGVRGTSALLAAEPQLDMARLWVMLLLAFDVVFVTLSLWTFESVMTE